jgi:diaminopimelate decarboxylase
MTATYTTRFPLDKFRRLDTPFYYYDLELLRLTLATLLNEAGHDSNFKVHYAVKANANPALLRVIANAGLGADCVSGPEISRAVESGFDPAKIVYAGVGKTDREIITALDHDIFCFNVESEAELEVINQLAADRAKRARVAIRVNPDVGAHTHANITTGLAENKFGISMADLDRVIDLALNLPAIDLVGLHFHIGSQILDMTDFTALCNRINLLQERLDLRGLQLPHINVGGGLGIDYRHPERHPVPDFKAYFDTYRRHLQLRPGQTLHFEIGRAIVAQCGSLVSRVTYVKQGASKQFAILDAGMTDLIRPALYQAFHKIENISNPEAPLEAYDVVGPVCESSDVFGKDVELPATHRGDLILLRSAGAYGEIMASGYNCRPLPLSYTSDSI